MSKEVQIALDKLNKMEVLDYDIDSDKTVIYIHIQDSEENRKALFELGATEEDMKTMLCGMEDTGCLDITEFAFFKLGAEFWSIKNGFSVD